MNTYATVKQMKEEIHDEIKKGVSLDEIKDRSGEWVDGYLPIYYSEILQEWGQMPSEYHDRGANELGTGGETTIYGLMGLDLYVYYTELFYEAVAEVEGEMEEVNA